MNSVATSAAQAEKPFGFAVFAAMIAGAGTFLNVYCTQPLLPFFQNFFHATEVQVSLTVGAVTLSVAITAPVIGLLAESIGRKKVIVPALFAMAVPTLLAATAQSLSALIFWRFMQGVFVPGVIAVIIAYINEEFAGRTGTVMSAYVAGTVFGGFLGRFLTGVIAAYWNWHAAFIVLGVLDLLGALAVRQWLPLARNFVPGQACLQIPRRHVGAFAKPAPAFDLLHGLHGAVLAGGRVHLRELFSRPPAVSFERRRAGQRVFHLSVWLRRHPAGGTIPGSQRLSPHGVAGRGHEPEWAAIDAGTLAADGYCRAGDILLRHLCLASIGDGANRPGGGPRPFFRRRSVCDFLLHRRQRGHGAARVVLAERRLAGCVGLFAAMSLVTLALGLAGGKSIATGEKIPGEIMDTAI